ncbi:MAG TPA: hypothetical protein VFJ81_03360, partial [Gemmatimonadales bacterium]|nr:hypothetical protein [Gemmatimonadales bacterium]
MSFLSNRSPHILTGAEPAPSAGAALPATVIANTSTPVPGGAGNFTFMTYPLASYGTVAFNGAGKDQPSNLYSSTSGRLVLALQVGTPIPSTGGKFTDFGMPVPAQQALLFMGSGSLGTSGLYVKSGEILQRIADTNTPVPSGSGNFKSFNGGIDFDVRGAIAFAATDAAGNQGVYASAFPSGGVAMVANSSTPIPGGSGTFNTFTSPSVSDYGVAFFASRTGSPPAGVGLYLSRNGALNTLANYQTAVPNTGGTFSGFGAPTIGGSAVAFHAIGSNGSQGIYLWRNGTLSVVADLTTPVPGGSGTFQVFFNDDPS